MSLLLLLFFPGMCPDTKGVKASPGEPVRCPDENKITRPKGCGCKIRIERSENSSYISCMEDAKNKGSKVGTMQDDFQVNKV